MHADAEIDQRQHVWENDWPGICYMARFEGRVKEQYKVHFGHPIQFSLMASPSHLLPHSRLCGGRLSLSVTPFASYGSSDFFARPAYRYLHR